ncbi:hypothetical protein ABBQ32_009245 [Trebouxia sp. C0010 RCD-2024]
MAVNPKPSSSKLDSRGEAVKRKRVQETAIAAKVHKKAKKDAAPVSGHSGRSADPKTSKPKTGKRNAALIQDITVKWETIRHPNTTTAQRLHIVNEIMEQVSGRVVDLAMSHTASRVIQACAKHGNDAHRQALLAETAPRVVDLAKSSYGHFLLSKLVTVAPKSQIAGIVKMFKGHVAHLVRHPCGAAIIDDVYHVASAQQRTAMVAELYGREFVLFSGEAKSITDFIHELPLPKQKAVIRNMAQHAIPIMEKALVDSPLVHRFLAEYIAVSPGSSVAEAVQLLAGPPLVRMVHTKQGAQVNCAVISYGSAKDRKKVIKAMAEHVDKLVDEEWGHTVLICALTLVDDTTLLRKSLVPELQKNLSELCKSKYGRRIILQLLHPDQQKYVPLHVQQMMHPPSKSASGFKTSEEQPIEQEQAVLGGSKKDNDVRRQEILSEGAGSLAGSLCSTCSAHVADMLRDARACDVILEVATAGSSGVLSVHHAAGVSKVQQSIAEAAGSEPPVKDVEGVEEHVMLQYFSSRAIRRLVLTAYDSEHAMAFPKLLWQAAFQGRCQQWLGTHAEKIMAALASCQDKTVKDALNSELQPILKRQVADWAAEFVLRGKAVAKGSNTKASG